VFQALLILFLVPTAQAEINFRLPSYLSFQGGVGDEGYRDGALSLGLTLPKNWQLEAGVDKTVVRASDDSGDLNFTGGRVGFGSDPLRLISVRVVAESWEVPDDVKANGGRVGLTFAPAAWIFTVEAIGQKMQFTGLPALVSSSQEMTVQDSGLHFRVSTIIKRDWSVFVSATGHTYDRDLSQLSDLPAVTLNNMPSSVLTALNGLSSNDASLGGYYMARRFDLGLEVGRSVSAIDGVRTRRAGLNWMFYMNRSWSFGLNTMTFRPESSQETSAASNSTSGIVTYKW